MPTLQEIEDLVRLHQTLDDPMDGAIWLQPKAREAWLLEVMPEIPLGASTYPPFVFGPSPNFRYSLYLIAGPIKALERDIRRNANLARWVAEGKVIQRSDAVARLVTAAKETLGHG